MEEIFQQRQARNQLENKPSEKSLESEFKKITYFVIFKYF